MSSIRPSSVAPFPPPLSHQPLELTKVCSGEGPRGYAHNCPSQGGCYFQTNTCETIIEIALHSPLSLQSRKEQPPSRSSMCDVRCSWFVHLCISGPACKIVFCSKCSATKPLPKPTQPSPLYQFGLQSYPPFGGGSRLQLP